MQGDVELSAVPRSVVERHFQPGFAARGRRSWRYRGSTRSENDDLHAVLRLAAWAAGKRTPGSVGSTAAPPPGAELPRRHGHRAQAGAHHLSHAGATEKAVRLADASQCDERAREFRVRKLRKEAEKPGLNSKKYKSSPSVSFRRTGDSARLIYPANRRQSRADVSDLGSSRRLPKQHCRCGPDKPSGRTGGRVGQCNHRACSSQGLPVLSRRELSTIPWNSRV